MGVFDEANGNLKPPVHGDRFGAYSRSECHTEFTVLMRIVLAQREQAVVAEGIGNGIRINFGRVKILKLQRQLRQIRVVHACKEILHRRVKPFITVYF